MVVLFSIKKKKDYATSHKRPFMPSVGGIGLLCDV